MGWLLVAAGAVAAIGGAARMFYIGAGVVRRHPHKNDAARNDERYVKPALRAFGISAMGMVLIVIGFVTLIDDWLASIE